MKRIRLLMFLLSLIVGGGSVWAQSWTAQAPANGDFYLYNVGTGKFLSCGEDWGTHAVVGNGALKFTLANNGSGAYTLYTINNFSFGNPNAAQLQSNGYVDQNVNATTWTFTEVNGLENTYTLRSAMGDYLYAPSDGKIKISLNSTVPTDNYGYWKLVNYDNLFPESASTENPVDVTCLIGDANFESSKASNLGWTMTAANQNLCGGSSPNKCAESWHSSNGFTLSQQITVPNGIYKLRAQAALSGSVTENDSPVIYATSGSSTVTVPFNAMQNGESSMGGLSTQFTNGNYYTDFIEITVKNNTLTVGAKGTRTDTWNVWDNFQLYYLGVDLSLLREALQDMINAVPELEGTTSAAAYNDLKSYADGIDVNGLTTKAAILEVSDILQEKTNLAKALQTPYANYKKTATDAVFAGVDNATITEQNEAVEAATTVDGVNACTTTLLNAINDLAFNITDFTITNPTAQTKNGWEGTNFGSQSDGVCEYWSVSGADFHQTITNLPAGNYRLTVTALQRTDRTGTVYAGEERTVIAQVASSIVNSRAQAAAWFNEGNGKNYVYFTVAETSDVVIGLTADAITSDYWTVWQGFKLETFDENVAAGYLAPGYGTLVSEAEATLADDAYINVTGDEKTALQNAIAAEPSTVAEYDAAVTALNNAVAAFTAAKTNYDIFATERALADAISTDIVVAAPTTAENALVQFRALKVAEYEYVATAYPYSATSKIGEFSTWTRTGTVNGNTKNQFEALTSQHWSGTAMTYYEQPADGWNQSAWTANYAKTTTLPAGNYVIKVAARAASSTNTKAKITCSAATLDGPIFNFGDTGKGITTDGVASFDEGEFANNGNGRGWVWNYLPFTLDKETEVTMTVVAEATGKYQWFSVCDGELLSMDNIATAVAYNDASANTIEDVDVANVTISRTIKEGFNTVVLPFNLTASQVQTVFGLGTEVFAFSETDQEGSEKVTINFNKVVAGTISANVPVLVKATKASDEQVFEGVEVVAPTEDVKVAGNNVSFIGVYAPATVQENDYFIANGKLFMSTGETSIKAFRAYIDAQGLAPEARISFFIDGETTDISDALRLNDKAESVKNVYDLQGRKVVHPTRGLYIVNGKKVIVK